MRELPILFGGPMVRAILDGRKTQTRRVSGLHVINAEPDRYEFLGLVSGPGTPHAAFHDRNTGAQVLVRSPYGRPGDGLWLREAWRSIDTLDQLSGKHVAEKCLEAGYRKPWAPIQYDADGSRVHWVHTSTPPHSGPPRPGRYRHSRFMPRWASRITLEVTSVRVERLQAISEADARAEGVEPNWCGPLDKGPNGTGTEGWLGDSWIHYGHSADGDPAYSARDSFQSLWESINGPGSWDANPWVWVIEFSRVEQEAKAA